MSTDDATEARRRAKSLEPSIEKIFDWILKRSPHTGSSRFLARLLLWLYDEGRFPMGQTSRHELDVERRNWACDLFEYAFWYEPHAEIKGGERMMKQVIEEYGKYYEKED